MNGLKLEIKLSLSSLTKYPVVLYADSFDESNLRTNIVQRFFENLGNKEEDKIIICCRTEYLDDNDTKWFKPKTGELNKKYIAPIDYNKIDLKDYVKRYVNLQIEKNK